MKQPLTLMILLLTTCMPAISTATPAHAQIATRSESRPLSRPFHALTIVAPMQQPVTATATASITVSTASTSTETLTNTAASAQIPLNINVLQGDIPALAFGVGLGILVLAGILIVAFVVVRRRTSDAPASILIGRQVIPLNQPSLVVGRTLLGSQDASVAEQHARLTLHHHRWVIELDQGQHMRVEGRLSRKNRLNNGAVVILGNMTSEARFTFRDTRLVPATSPTQEVR